MFEAQLANYGYESVTTRSIKIPLADGSHLEILNVGDASETAEVGVIWHSLSQEPQCMFSAPITPRHATGPAEPWYCLCLHRAAPGRIGQRILKPAAVSYCDHCHQKAPWAA